MNYELPGASARARDSPQRPSSTHLATAVHSSAGELTGITRWPESSGNSTRIVDSRSASRRRRARVVRGKLALASTAAAQRSCSATYLREILRFRESAGAVGRRTRARRSRRPVRARPPPRAASCPSRCARLRSTPTGTTCRPARSRSSRLRPSRAAAPRCTTGPSGMKLRPLSSQVRRRARRRHVVALGALGPVDREAPRQVRAARRLLRFRRRASSSPPRALSGL